MPSDLSFAFRSLIRNRGFTLAALATLALGVGATTAIFSVVNGVLLRPLPWPDADRAVTIYGASVSNPDGRGTMSAPDIDDLAALPALETLVGYTPNSMTLTGMGEATLVQGARVTQGVLSTFGLAPYMGRDLRREEMRPGQRHVVMVGYGFWQERLGGDPAVLGRTLELSGERYEIVGVAPAGFDFPQGARLWRPYQLDEEECGRGCHLFSTVGRLADPGGLAVLRDQADALAVRLEQEYRDSNFEKRFNVQTLATRMVGDVRSELWILLAAVGLVLLVACANVANLLLARSHARLPEVAVRAALGASRARLIAQVLTESLVLAVLGGGAGLGLAYWGVDLLRRISPDAVPRIDEIALDGTVLLFALGLVVLVALLFGLSPAIRLSRSSPARALGRTGRGNEGSLRSRSRSALLAAEVGLSLVLLVGAGLLLKTFVELRSVEPGFETENTLRFTLVLPEARYSELDAITGFYRELEGRIRSLPGVAAVGSIFGAPLGTGNITGGVLHEGMPDPDPADETYASLKPVTPGYLETARIPVLRGRGIQATDRQGTETVALVNESFVRENFPDEDPLGKRVRITVSFDWGSPYWTIVGVVPDLRSSGLTRGAYPEIYVPQAQMGPGFMTVTVRTVPGAGPMLPAIRAQVRAMDANLPLRAIQTMRQAVDAQMATTRFYVLLLGIFAGLAVILAAVGLYGVVAYLVARRRREIGIRMALGAEAGEVVGLVLRQAAVPTLAGVVGGIAVALAAGRVLESFLFQVEPRDPVVFAAVTAVLVLVAGLASFIPARQASRVDPVEALRSE